MLVLVRHGESRDNELNIFSGWRDPALTSRGIEEARNAGLRLKDAGFQFDMAFSSNLGRARQTLRSILDVIGQPDLEAISDRALDERDYGELSGLNKEEARSVWGSDQVHLWRKSYRAVPPGGESLAMTADRTMEFFSHEIQPRLTGGDRVLVVAHGNSLRSIVKHLDHLSDDEIVETNIATGQILVYGVAGGGLVKKASIIVTI